MLKRPHLIDSGVLLAYTIISVLMTWPLVANLSGHILFGTIDEYMFMWGFWWMRYSLQDLHTWPFHTDMLYHPFGTGLAFHGGLAPAITTLSIPIQNIWSVEVAYNLAVLAAFIFSAFTMYLLVNYLVGDKRAAFIGGIVFAFSSFKFMQSSGHLHIISTEFFPLYVLFFIKMLRESPHQRRHAAFAGLSLGLIFLVDYYQTVYAIFFSLCYLVYYLFGLKQPVAVDATAAANPAPTRMLHLAARRVSNRQVLLFTLGLLAILGVVFLIVGSPLLYADYKDISGGYYVKWGGEGVYYADMAGFFVPFTPLLRTPFILSLNGMVIGNGGVEAVVYAGWVVILLVAIGTLLLTRRLADFRFWLVFIIICFLFALGPQPHFLGHPLPIPGPYTLWAAVPLLNNARIPSRFDLLITFAAAVLVAYTVRELWAWLTQRWPRFKPALLAATLLLLPALMLLEHLIIPLSVSGYALNEPTSALAQIEADPGDFAVLDLPLYDTLHPKFGMEHIMYEQSFHHKNVLGGSISRPLPDFYNYYINDEYINILNTGLNGPRVSMEIQKVLTNTKAMNFYRTDGARLVYYLDIRYLIAHPPALPAGALRFLTETLPLTQIYPSGKIGDTVIYRVQTDQLASQAEISKVGMGDGASDVFRLMGWAAPEKDAKLGGNFVWMTRVEGQMLAPVRTPADYTITMNLKPMIQDGKPQSLSIYLNDETSPAATIPQLTQQRWQEHTVTISRDHWRSGINKMRLQMSYAAQPGNGDPRTLSLAVSTITFTQINGSVIVHAP